MHPALVARAKQAAPVWFASTATWRRVRQSLGKPARRFADGFEPEPGAFRLLPGGGAVLGIEPPDAAYKDPFLPGVLAERLPAGVWRFANTPHDARLGALAFALGRYRFGRYRKAVARDVRLVVPDGVDARELSRLVDAVTLTRDLVNTPANDMGPADLEAAVRELARRHGVRARSVEGERLLRDNFPLIHAVGRAAAQAPRLIDFSWGDPRHPRVTVVGKGVCFDTGGLNIKPDTAMRMMKKDMGGAATALALAQLLMERKARVRLRVLVPAVENSIGGDAYRPLDVYKARNGVTVEIGHTDSEGRLVLADALVLACEDKPDLLIDLGTLTGAARTALGPDLPAFYTDDEALAADVYRHAEAESDPVWRLPLWKPYNAMLESPVADINNDAPPSMAGSITCALFLQRFVDPAVRWLHFDIYAWNASSKPGRPEGGECQVARALDALLKERYG